MKRNPVEYPDTLFLINPANEPFARSQSDHLENNPSVRKVLRFAGILIVFIVLPLSILFYFVYSILIPGSLGTATALTVAVMLVVVINLCTYGYRNARKLSQEGFLTVGEVLRYDTTLTADTRGYKRGTKLLYKFTMDGKVIEGNKIVSTSPTHLGDGRNLPETGTPLAILYMNEKWHTPL